MVTLLIGQDLFESTYAFTNPLPIPEIIDATNGRDITLQVRQTSQFLGLYDLYDVDHDGVYGEELSTAVWRCSAG